jgi:hypothetical protein
MSPSKPASSLVPSRWLKRHQEGRPTWELGQPALGRWPGAGAQRPALANSVPKSWESPSGSVDKRIDGWLSLGRLSVPALSLAEVESC